MATIDQKLEAWKNKLLDLGKRNRLLNYRDTKRSNLRIIKPTIFELWESFVVHEKPLEFPYYDDEQMSLFEDETEGCTNAVLTNQPIKEQQKTLRSLRDKAKTAMEEQGVNILYLSFGFLRWREDSNSDQYFLSPIVLVPAKLTLESITSPFTLGLHDDEIAINPTLLYKLSNDFGIELPEFDPDDSIKNYLNGISALTKNNKWEVIYDTGLSLLSFLKINMYRDLDIHKEKIKSNPVVRALTGDVTAIVNTCDSIHDYDHDAQTVPVELFQVVDADSSQQDAILLSKRGTSFVLQGPPGTGKSQTITNIIAECLASGKKVLFVSEKMAALEVVRKRLTTAGLADFCLTLHSYKANKKDILEQLSTVLNLSKQKAMLSDDAFQKLDLLQDDKRNLNHYAQQLFEVVEPLGKSIYQVNGYLANLVSYENLVFDIVDVADSTPQKFNRYINLLTHFASTIGKMSDDYKSSPWNDANVTAVTNELSHDIGAHLPKMLPKIKHTSDICDHIYSDLSLAHPSSYIGLSELRELLTVASRSPKAPVDWIVGEDITPLWSEIDRFTTLQKAYRDHQNELLEIFAELTANDSRIKTHHPTQITTTAQVAEQIDILNRAVAEDYCYSVWQAGKYLEAQTVLNEGQQHVYEIHKIRNHLLSTFERHILDLDFKQILARFKTEYTSFFRIFNRQYRADRKTMRSMYKQVVRKVSDNEIVAILTALRSLEEAGLWLTENTPILTKYFGNAIAGEKTDFEALSKLLKAYACITQSKEKLAQLLELTQTIESSDAELRDHFEFLYSGITTNWPSAQKSLYWARDFRSLCERYAVSKLFVEYVCTDVAKIAKCSEHLANLSSAVKDLDMDLTWYLKLFENREEIMRIPMPALYDRVQEGLSSLALLEEWIDFRNARTSCINEGLGDYVKKIAQLNIKVEHIVPMFKKRFFRLWLDAILPKYPAVLNFRRRVQERTIDEFVYLDKLQFDIAQARIKKKLIDDLPSFDRVTAGIDELNILKRELGKQRRIMPIRKLFRAIPNLLMILKPCLMMSPLSVSLFLAAESYDFDTIIFDEASQVCTENAVGAISRGKQVIIAGDSKQLPPTNFFNASISEADFDYEDSDEEYDDTNAYESILDEAGLLPERTLLWHYRSRHEHLIAFSNSKIYKNNLITFPSNVDKIPDNGVEYVYVSEGFYDRGGKKGNIIEAKRVAELVFEHFKTFPNRSLGVIAFGEVQQQAIDTVLRQMRKENPRFEVFFKEDKEEAFFVKNLENVQGDERDTIIFSIGYAKDANGKFAMNFGPLSKVGGERRLNVAITRAKLNVKLVGSILPTDIETERISAEGPKLLRSYIDFAINGPSVILREAVVSDIVEHDSPFEAAVYNFLERKGYKLATQVGCSGYRIDIAVKHPSISGRYVIGIECDGAAYHSARTARERDRLRQAVLEDMGWKIYRIWSTDWIKDPITEGQRLLEVVEKAITGYIEEACNSSQAPPPIVEDTFLSINNRDSSQEDGLNPYGFGQQRYTDFSDLPRDANGYVNLGDCIKAAVANEYPLHYELLCKKVAPLFGNEKATVKIRREVDYALRSLKGVVRKGDFFYAAGYTKIIPRALGNTRQVNHISPDELAEAMFVIVSKSYGIMRDSLFQIVAREFGFARASERIQVALQHAYEVLLNSGRVKESDGKVVVL